MNDKILYEQIGQRVAGYRRALGLKQEDVAKRLGISRASLANMEVGRQRFLVHQLYRLAEALDLHGPEDLMPKLLKKGATTTELSMSGAKVSDMAREQLAELLAGD